MAERVLVVVDAKDNASGILRGITSQMGALGGAIEHMTGASINWGNVAEQATRLIINAMQEAFKVATEYASSVRDLSLASGATAEEASRLLQVLDDFEIKANDVTAATRALTKNGLAPTVDTIAQLSDQYLLLNSAEERNAFITENLGRGGAKWANVLKEGSANIRALNDSVNAGLILNDTQIAQYEEMRLNIDSTKDSFAALQVSFVNSAVPTLNNLLTELNINIQESGTGIGVLRFGFDDLYRAIFNVSRAGEDITKTQALVSDAIAETAISAENASAGFEKILSLTQKLNDATREQIKLAGYQQLKDQLSASDGILTPEETDLLNEAGIALGVFDRNAVNSASSVTKFTAELVAGNIQLSKYVTLLNSIPTSIDVQINQVTVNSTQGSILAGNSASINAKAEGGPVESGRTYLVGEKGPELFTPPSNGNIVPNDQLTGTNNFFGNNTFILAGEGGSFMEQR